MVQDTGLEMQTDEPYTKLHPLPAFTNGVGSENAAAIERIVTLLNATDINGVLHLSYWFVIAVGIKR
jgi:hypothetical protein